MKIQLNLYASLSRCMPEGIPGDHVLELDAGMRVKEILERLGVSMESVKMIFVNGRHATPETVLVDGDRVGVFPPVAGG